MAIKDGNLNLNFPDLDLGISARRIWEHTQHRQINPFPAITIHTAGNPEAFVDVVDISGPYEKYTGITLEQVRRGQQWRLPREKADALLTRVKMSATRQWLRDVGWLLRDALDRKAVRNAPERFLPPAPSSPLGIAGMRCALADWLQARRKEKALSQQWHNRIQNLTQKGLKQAEIDATGIKLFLLEDMPDDVVLNGEMLRAELGYTPYQLSIIPVINPASSHLTWKPAPHDNSVKRIKSKIKDKHPTTPQWYDPIMGYWVDLVEWDDLFGQRPAWIVFNHRGKPLLSRDNPSGLYDSPEQAKARANSDAAKISPKLSTRGSWGQYRLTGGENYREWLITLPYYPLTYFSGHFAHRNVLIHVRCDIREGVNGEKVLFLQEVQSDWAQQARREMREYEEEDWEIPSPPWLQEWPALALKRNRPVITPCQKVSSCAAVTHATGTGGPLVGAPLHRKDRPGDRAH